MQFNHNADHPAVNPLDGSSLLPQAAASASAPLEFPPVQPVTCARITTRVFHPARNQVATVQNVLVKTTVNAMSHNNSNQSKSDVSWSSDEDDDMSSDDDNNEDGDVVVVDAADNDDDDDDAMKDEPNHHTNTFYPNNNSTIVVEPPEQQQQHEEHRAYWIQRTIREAIYGRVWLAIVLKPLSAAAQANLGSRHKNNNNNATTTTATCEWQVTSEFCAVKEMSWQHIRKERNRLAEDPIQEVASMQYLKRWHTTLTRQRQQQQQQQQPSSPSSTTSPLSHPSSPSHNNTNDPTAEAFRIILETNIMMPLDLLTDDRHLYSIMPYCNGGELFDRLDMNERFSEGEARYWMVQVLNGIENLQDAGICHRDMSLENLLVHRNGALIIDMGMCLRIPFEQPQQQAQQSAPLSADRNHASLATSFGNLTVNGTTTAATTTTAGKPHRPRRLLIKPQGTCGKWIYMSPEIYRNAEAFDGFAVDMWAAGVILFLMLTGFPPWERACPTDERFRYMTAGYLVQMLTEWEIGLSGDAMDLLQRMLFLDPKDRLCLQQVKAHPWMTNGPLEAPVISTDI
uniref:Protein kinase domain-containing protein n=1 Tax=Amphora coffeiformis TaxID=265554 RepID=A0A7S3P5F0_9STRA